jgi:uncharacterized protein (TIGR01244 family)
MSDFDFVPNQCRPDNRLFCGGQPTPEQLQAFAREGGGCVVNLRPDAEMGGWDEGAAVRALDMEYVHIPVAGADDLNRDAATRLADAMKHFDADHLMVHCASGQRVGALVALKAGWVDGLSADRAIELGRQAGLERLEPVVRSKLVGG